MVNTFNDLMNAERFLARSRMNVCLRGGGYNNPIRHFETLCPVRWLKVSISSVLCIMACVYGRVWILDDRD